MERFCSHLLLIIFIAGCASNTTGEKRNQGPPYQANGIKIGELDHNSAIVWTRLTQNPTRKIDGISFSPLDRKKVKNKVYRYEGGPQIPTGHTLDEMKNAVPGSLGEVRIVYWQDKKRGDKFVTPWKAVNPNCDFTHQFTLCNLRPGIKYNLEVECRKGVNAPLGQTVKGYFQTAPEPAQPLRVVFTVVTGQNFYTRDNKKKGHKIYPVMLDLEPSFFVHTGDIVYLDSQRGPPLAFSVDLARFKWTRMYSLPFQRDFHNRVASYFIKDDHDTWQNDCWPSMQNNKMRDFTFEQGQEVFREQVPMGKRTFRTVRWGKDLQIWLVEGRDFRSANTMPDGPEKTIWGEEQKEWFKRTVRESDATFRILISPTPLVGPDRETKADNHSNKAFAYEGNELRCFISQQENMVVICGDRHWQYVSVDPETGLREYSCGPTSDEHAGGYSESQRKPMHQYLNICGGFLSVTVERVNGTPTMVMRHHSVDGRVLHEDILTANVY